jgi:hypothetical protein
MSPDTDTALQRSLEAADHFRRRVTMVGWFVVVATVGVYGWLTYLHNVSDDIERLLGASVAALTFVIAWVAYSLVIVINRSTRAILQAIELSSRRS